MTPALRCFLSLAAAALPLLNAQPQPPAPPVANVSLAAQSDSWLGVAIADVNAQVANKLGLDSVQGVEVGHVVAESPADEAGLERGDVITRFRDETVQGVEHFARLVRETPPGSQVELEVWDENGRHQVEVEIGRREKLLSSNVRPENFKLEQFDFDLPRPRMVVMNRSLGAEMEALEGQLAGYFGVAGGVLVRSVADNTPASRAGLQAGDVITKISGDGVANPSDVRNALGRADEQPVELTVMRKGAQRRLHLTVERQRSFGSPFQKITRVR